MLFKEVLSNPPYLPCHFFQMLKSHCKRLLELVCRVSSMTLTLHLRRLHVNKLCLFLPYNPLPILYHSLAFQPSTSSTCSQFLLYILPTFCNAFGGYFPPNLFRVSISQWGSACGKSSDKILEKHPWGYSYFECQLEI